MMKKNVSGFVAARSNWDIYNVLFCPRQSQVNVICCIVSTS